MQESCMYFPFVFLLNNCSTSAPGWFALCVSVCVHVLLCERKSKKKKMSVMPERTFKGAYSNYQRWFLYLSMTDFTWIAAHCCSTSSCHLLNKNSCFQGKISAIKVQYQLISALNYCCYVGLKVIRFRCDWWHHLKPSSIKSIGAFVWERNCKCGRI